MQCMRSFARRCLKIEHFLSSGTSTDIWPARPSPVRFVTPSVMMELGLKRTKRREKPCSTGTYSRPTSRMRRREEICLVQFVDSSRTKSSAFLLRSLPSRRTFHTLQILVLMVLDDDSINQLTALVNDSMYNGTISNDWLDSHLAALPKPEKDHTKIASYRIITMQNCIGKLCEKSVGRSVAQDLEDNESLPSTLGSYRRGKETWMNAAVLASDIYDGFERGEETLVVALDLEDAYNRVRYDVLLRTMVRMGVRPQLIIWIGEALLKRNVALRVGMWTSERRTITPGGKFMTRFLSLKRRLKRFKVLKHVFYSNLSFTSNLIQSLKLT